jgi:hypothetical protein
MVRVMKFAFFFSYSEAGGCSGALGMSASCYGGAEKRGLQHTGGATAPFLVGLAGCDSFSLISDMLCEGRRARPLLALLGACWNLTSLRGRVMLATSGGAGSAWGEVQEQPMCALRRGRWCDCGSERR